MNFEFEKDVPPPERGVGPNGKYPFSEMEVGDSILWRRDPQGVSASQCKAATAARGTGWRMGRKYVTKDAGDGVHVRIWRVE